MAKDFFNQRKKSILSKKDKSSKGDWDEKIVKLCEKINSLENYYTTSSCSGRVVIIKDKDEKGPGLFEFVSHDLLNEKEFLNKIAHFVRINDKSSKSTLSDFSDNEFIKVKIPRDDGFEQTIRRVKMRSNLNFKQEPPILHVLCENFEDAKKLLKKVHVAGWKRSGIIACEKHFVVEIMSTEKLEFPLTKNGKMLVDENFLKIIIKKSNNNLKKGWNKIEKLEKLIK